MKNIGIIGCGWLGLPLAKHLAAVYPVVKGTSRNAVTLADLQAHGVAAYPVALSPNEIDATFKAFIQNLTTIVIAVNASRSESYFDTMQLLGQAIAKSTVKEVVFLSSTSVYSDLNQTLDETDPVDETKLLVRVEAIFKNNAAFKTTILRLGGLVGPTRNPITSLTGRNLDQNPNAPVNLVGLADCIGAICAVIKKNCPAEIFNVVYPEHPTKLAYYTQAAKSRNLLPPTYNEQAPLQGKIVLSDKITQKLGYQFTDTI
ncbi:SDR family NAD(P)-dependent oxidoreductase [Flavobacterium agricola]|uniref:SDR family NAD(P)-dependent oxidoreductase n=1 Tax=Flavobacterium agricola TaxID=2870839 RepID=A0ABY6M2H5_9FLAO|nr:SDR family NAD(P)-dependent oxidoreductase [Flavobacterium agricola]UYW01103.1 SDR family NAD(P)-dependent oxidoreductase [Flavobacterium agricola]